MDTEILLAVATGFVAVLTIFGVMCLLIKWERQMKIKGYDIKPGVDLSGANLSWANLYGADLSRANLSWADLRGANLSRADLHGAILFEADLSRADLHWARLSEANLSWADLSWADLSDTCLDPSNEPNGQCEGFDREDEYCIGYRSHKSRCVGCNTYYPGGTYNALAFSTSDTECHPGLYVCPTICGARKYSPDVVKVRFRPEDCHKAGDKWRVRTFDVIEFVEGDSK